MGEKESEERRAVEGRCKVWEEEKREGVRKKKDVVFRRKVERRVKKDRYIREEEERIISDCTTLVFIHRCIVKLPLEIEAEIILPLLISLLVVCNFRIP